MDNDNRKTFEKDSEAVASSQARPQENRQSTTGRPDLNEINRRNAEEEKREKKSTYTIAGLIAFFVIFVIILVYFFS